MADMLVKLYAIDYSFNNGLSMENIEIKKACIIDKPIIMDFVKKNFADEPAWVFECEYALFNNPISCYIAVCNKEIVGFSCYDATAKGFFGPMGIKKSFRKRGIGRELLLKSLYSMKESGYAYAVIGWPAQSAAEFYKSNVSAVEIEDSQPSKSIYRNLIG